MPDEANIAAQPRVKVTFSGLCASLNKAGYRPRFSCYGLEAEKQWTCYLETIASRKVHRAAWGSGKTLLGALIKANADLTTVLNNPNRWWESRNNRGPYGGP
jgi:hypothetical protein